MMDERKKRLSSFSAVRHRKIDYRFTWLDAVDDSVGCQFPPPQSLSSAQSPSYLAPSGLKFNGSPLKELMPFII
jgi:hypothetical protein